jgi:hypothetical protein
MCAAASGAHNHYERNHQGLRNQFLVARLPSVGCGAIRRRQRVVRILNYYDRAAPFIQFTDTTPRRELVAGK